MHTQQEIIDSVIPILQKYPIKRAALFGSYARGEHSECSDIDIIVDSQDLLDDLYLLWDSLEDYVGKSFDIINFKSLDRMPPVVATRIRNDMRWFYEV